MKVQWGHQVEFTHKKCPTFFVLVRVVNLTRAPLVDSWAYSIQPPKQCKKPRQIPNCTVFRYSMASSVWISCGSARTKRGLGETSLYHNIYSLFSWGMSTKNCLLWYKARKCSSWHCCWWSKSPRWLPRLITYRVSTETILESFGP